MKQSKLAIALEVAYVAYMLAMIWLLFPSSHYPLARAASGARYFWRLGREQARLTRLPGWAQEAAEVRGRLPHAETAAPRPFNLDGD